MEPHPFTGINQRSYSYQFAVFVMIALSSLTIFSLIGSGILLIFGGEDLLKAQINGFENISQGDINLFKIAQIVSSIGVFICPALLFSFLKTGDHLQYLQWKKEVDVSPTIMSAVVMMVAFPVLIVFMMLNQAMVLPDFLHGMEEWMKTQELQLAELTLAFLKMDGLGDFLLNLLMIAIIPAIGEEMLFRGGLQKLLQEWTNKPHLAIFLSAAIFSAIHMQFYGFLPRMVIGMLLGYLFYWSGNLWYPIIGHFINNGVQVVAVYMGQLDAASEPPSIGTMPADAQMSLFLGVSASLLLSGLLLKAYRKHFLT